MSFGEEEVLAALRDVYDPELPVNIVDLGLVYRVKVERDTTYPGTVPKHRIAIDMTLTNRNCPAHGMITEAVLNRLAGLEQVCAAEVRLVWEPAWSPERIRPETRARLRSV